MNSETIILLSTITTGLLALFALCVKYAYASNCFNFKCCWGCIQWQKDPSEHNREIALSQPQVVPNSPNVNNNENLGNLNNI